MTTGTKPVKFPVICEEAGIEPGILNAVLDEVGFVLVANPDLSQLLAKHDRPIDSVHTVFTTPFTAKLPDGIEPLRAFMAAAKINKDISSKVFIILDEQTAKDGKTCQVTTHDDSSDEDNYEFRVPFRCELNSALAAAQALEAAPDQYGHTTARALRNEAAIAGGVWTQEAAERQDSQARERAARISAARYPQSEDWDEFSGTVESEDSRPYIPIFRTAEISQETLNTFIQEAYSTLPETDPTIAPYTMALVTSLQHPFHSGPATKRPLTSVPALPPILLGATPRECDILTRHLFPPQDKSELNYNRFIVMDQLTKETQIVLLACNNEFNQLQLLRSDSKNALLAILAPENTILTMNEQAAEAASTGDGVGRWH